MVRRYADQGLAVMQGYKMGAQAVRGFLKDKKEAEVSDQIAAVDTNFQPRETPVVSGEDAYAAGQQAYDNAMAGATTDEQKAEVARNYQPTLQALADQRATPASVVRSMGVGNAFQQRDTQFSPQEIDSAKTQARAGIYQRAGREDDAARVLLNAARSRELADQDQLRAATAVPSRAQTAAASGIGVDETGGDAQPTNGAVNAPAAAARAGARALRDPLDSYLRDVAPKAIQTLVQQGRVTEAKHYSDFLESRDGQAYAKTYMQAVRDFAVGDHEGSLQKFETLYNEGIPDGRRVKLTALDGDQMRVDQIDAQGKIIGSKTGKIADLTEQAALALNPLQAVKFMAEQQGKRKTEGALLDRQVQLEGLRQKGRETQDDRRDERLGMRLDANNEALDRRLSAQSSALERRLQAQADRGLTTAQQQKNDAIDAAREQLSGLSAADVQKRTTSTQANGRVNDLYDPQLARTARLANTRKFGDDPEHDQFSAGKKAENAAANTRAEIVSRFRADKSMQSRRLGADTPNGVEVWEKGKLIGYFR